MADFSFSGEEQLFRDAVRDFLSSEVSPIWQKIDEGHRIPTELIHKMGDQGLFAIAVPEEYGGQGGTFTLTAIAAEEIGYHDPSMALAVFTLLNNAWPYMLYRYGGEVKNGILELVGKGRAFFGIASTEPQGGSDVAGIRTRAEKHGSAYKVYGEKIFISGVREVMEQLDYGGWFLIARTGRQEDRHKALTAFAFLGKWNGKPAENMEYSILSTIGRHGISTGILSLKGAEIPEDNVIGEVNRGFYIAMEGFNLARILVAAANIGAARWALERTIEYARGRELFEGKPISSFQGVSFPIAEAAMELEAARLLVYKAAWMADRIYIKDEAGLKPKDLRFYSASAKLKAVNTAKNIFDLAMQVHGAISYTKELDIHRGLLASYSYYVGAEGAQNIMRYIIASEVIGREYVK